MLWFISWLGVNDYPFGTVLKVTNKENGRKSVLVVVTDRGGLKNMEKDSLSELLLIR